MNRRKAQVVRVLSVIGWFAIWLWIFDAPLWGWEMPWEVFRVPLAGVVAMATGWPLRNWLDSTDPADHDAG